MRAAVAKEHRDFFKTRGWIRLESILPEKAIHLINEEIDSTLAHRLLTEPNRLQQEHSDLLFAQGHDLWRESDSLKRLLSHPNLTTIASELSEKSILRLGYDQLLPAKAKNEAMDGSQKKGLYSLFLDYTLPLEEFSSLEGILCAVMIALADPIEEKNQADEDASSLNLNQTKKSPFPQKKGEALFFSPAYPLDWSDLYLRPKQRFYLIVYVANKTTYRLQPQDPHAHSLKHLGHLFNNSLTDKLNPIVHR